MTLKSAIDKALVVTGGLAAALNDDQLGADSDLLARRGAIMADFQVVHEAATSDDKKLSLGE